MWEGRRVLPSKNFDVNNSLTAVRNQRRHAELRKPWDAALKPSTIVDYYGMLAARTEQLVEKLKELSKSQASINLSLWINYFTFVVFYQMDDTECLFKCMRSDLILWAI